MGQELQMNRFVVFVLPRCKTAKPLFRLEVNKLKIKICGAEDYVEYRDLYREKTYKVIHQYK